MPKSAPIKSRAPRGALKITAQTVRRRLAAAWQRIRRDREQAEFRSFRLSRGKRARKAAKPVKLPGSSRLLLESLGFFKKHFKLLGSLAALYVPAQWLIKGLQTGSNLSDTGLGAGQNPAALAAGTLGGIVNPPLSDLQQFAGSLLTLIFVLSLVWAARYASAGKNPTVRQALYNSPRPLIAVLLIILVMTLQSLPGLLGALILSYTLGQPGGLSGAEAMMFALAAGLMVVLTVYWLLQSFMALVIVTLPNTYPVAALRLAKQLVMGRRLMLLRRLLVAALWFAVAWTAAAVPLALLGAKLNGPIALTVPALLGALDGLGLVLSTIYFYKLYRQLL
ncbi:MAG: hypothetical protein EOT04_00175 [Candidatus Chaera renei]|uniref:Uncharacterized protein n=1 Tax=Candidatus Chaera renei TaxID=2506947 RepID=A0A4Q0AK95_9BACT|nr:MAG: hypothetical protein EOT04_00175 [Candidatus Chaera renei]